jgi:hypothetical protein
MKDIKEILLEGKNNSLPWSSSAAWIYVLSCIANKNERKLFNELLNKRIFSVDEAKEIISLLKKFVPEGVKLEYINDVFDALSELNIKPQKSQLQINN